MTCYRSTRLKALNPGRIKEIGEEMHNGLGADFIDVTRDDANNMVVIARYSDKSIMEAAIPSTYGAFGQMIMKGVHDSSSIEQWPGEVVIPI